MLRARLLPVIGAALLLTACATTSDLTPPLPTQPIDAPPPPPPAQTGVKDKTPQNAPLPTQPIDAPPPPPPSGS